jgi:probable addiction module antidote protein
MVDPNLLEIFNAPKLFENEEDIADYITDMLADGNAALTQHALSVAVRAAGMMKICDKAGLTRQGINKAQRKNQTRRQAASPVARSARRARCGAA